MRKRPGPQTAVLEMRLREDWVIRFPLLPCEDAQEPIVIAAEAAKPEVLDALGFGFESWGPYSRLYRRRPARGDR